MTYPFSLISFSWSRSSQCHFGVGHCAAKSEEDDDDHTHTHTPC